MAGSAQAGSRAQGSAGASGPLILGEGRTDRPDGGDLSGREVAAVGVGPISHETLIAAAGQALPEIKFTWRRIYAYGATAGLTALAGVATCRAQPGDMQPIALTSLVGVFGMALLYMDGAKTEGLTRLVEAAGLFRAALAHAALTAAEGGPTASSTPDPVTAGEAR